MNYDDMPAGPEMVPYHLSDKGRAKRREYYEKTKGKHMERKRAARERHAIENPEEVRARHLLGQAVRMGFIPKPPNEVTRTWNNRWEFHHPDHSRPYFGCWVRPSDHRMIDKGKMPCPPCTDWTDAVVSGVAKSWGLCRAVLKAVEE